MGTTRMAGDQACFAKSSHAGRIKVAFCEGHVETPTLNYGTPSRVYLLAP